MDSVQHESRLDAASRRTSEAAAELRGLSPLATAMLAIAAAAVSTLVVSMARQRQRGEQADKEEAAKQLAKLIVRVMADEEPEAPNAYVYAFHELDDNLPSLVEGVGRLRNASHNALNVLVTNVSNADLACPIEGWSGAEKLVPLLEARLDEDEDCVQLVPFPFTDMCHTLNEAKAVVDYCDARGVRDLIICAPPFHLPRAVMTTISVAIRELPHLRIWAASGPAQSWNEAAAHSQGKIFDSRAAFIDGELERIERYTSAGDIAPASAILAYLATRGTSGGVTIEQGAGGSGSAAASVASP